MRNLLRWISRPVRGSLRVKVALGVALPTFLLLSTLSMMHYLRETTIVEQYVRMTAVQLGDMALGGLRHSMLVNDQELFRQILRDMGQMEDVQRVQVVDLEGRVRADSQESELGQVRHVEDPGCSECHSRPPDQRPRTLLMDAPPGTLRISAPIVNEPACARCHDAGVSHLGMLLLDVSIIDLREHIFEDITIDLAISTIGTLLVTLGVYTLVHRLVVRRAESFRKPLAAFAAGSFDQRLPATEPPRDELDELAATFNRMADELNRYTREQAEQSEMPQRAIAEERERIARELHDGLAQLLGYVNTKAMAARLMLRKEDYQGASENLVQLEQAARELFVEVREAIVGLRLASQAGEGIMGAMQALSQKLGRLSGIPIELAIAPQVSTLRLPAESELQLTRIAQEALTNVRKHASASQAWISLEIQNGALEMTIGDNGVGFDPAMQPTDGRPHFGLSTMRERAEAIGASFQIDTEPGAGTRVIVRLPLEESEDHASSGS